MTADTLALAVVAVTLAGLGLPLVLRKVPPNRYFGVRMPATIADPRVWYEVNAQSGRHMVGLGVALLVMDLYLAGIVGPVVQLSCCAGVLLVGVVGISVAAYRRSNGLLRELRRRGG